MRCIAVLLLASPVVPALAASAHASSSRLPADMQLSAEGSLLLRQLRSRQLNEAEMVEEEETTEVEEEEAPGDEEAPADLDEPVIEPEVDTGESNDDEGLLPGQFPVRPPSASGQFPVRPVNEPGGGNPFGSACKAFVDIPASSTECTAAAYSTESRCMTVPGCSFTATNGCTGAFDSRACADMSQEVCENSFFCTYDDTFASSNPEPPEPAAPPAGSAGGSSSSFGGAGDPRSQFGDYDDDASETNGGWTGGFGTVGRDTVGPGGAATDGDGSTGILSYSPVPETPLVPFEPVSSSLKLVQLCPILNAFALGSLVAVISAFL